MATMRDPARRERLEKAARDAGLLDRIEIHALDVTIPDQIASLASLVEKRATPLHGLVNNAGFAMGGFAEDVSDTELRTQFDTNFFGAAAVTRAFLPQMRQQGFGHVVMVSSVSGRMAFPGLGSYVASKFALEGWTETLRLEMKSLGVQVVLVEPGSFDTDIWDRNAHSAAGLTDPSSPNADRAARLRARMESQVHRANPAVVAERIARILENPRPRLRYVMGSDARMGLTFRKLLPWALFERIIIQASGLDR